MLVAYPPDPAGQSKLADGAWIDLIDPTSVERSTFEDTFGLRVPAQDELGEIEATSRLQFENGALYMTAPLIVASANEAWLPVPTGFVLSKQVLMTLRSGKSAAFDCAAKELWNQKFEPSNAFATVLEELIDHLADLLEGAGRDLDETSHVIFSGESAKHLSHETALLRQLMIRTGRTSERMSRIHYTLICLDRMSKFTCERAREWLQPDIATRLQAVSSDVASLIQFSEGLVSRVQLLQDAAGG